MPVQPGVQSDDVAVDGFVVPVRRADLLQQGEGAFRVVVADGLAERGERVEYFAMQGLPGRGRPVGGKPVGEVASVQLGDPVQRRQPLLVVAAVAGGGQGAARKDGPYRDRESRSSSQTHVTRRLR